MSEYCKTCGTHISEDDTDQCHACQTKSSFAAPHGSARASVRLKISDWEALINFVNGDLANMAYDDPTGTQLTTILDAIRRSMVKALNAALSGAKRKS